MIPLPALTLFVLDMPAMRGSHAIFPGLYFAVVADKSARNFRGGQILESVDGWETYDVIANVAKLATAGICRWLSESDLEVNLFRGELHACKMAHLDLGKNRAMVGPELVAFQDAVLDDGERMYQVTVPRRGLRGSPRTVGNDWHPFVLLDQDVIYHELTGEVGLERQYKALCSGQRIESTDAVKITPSGRNAQGFRWLWEGQGYGGTGGDSYA